MKHNSANRTLPAPQLRVKTNLLAGKDACKQETEYWRDQYNRLVREGKRLGCGL
ncbi:MAG: hypothetical protein ACKOC5_15730 [Chloroflexota bacterium]